MKKLTFLLAALVLLFAAESSFAFGRRCGGCSSTCSTQQQSQAEPVRFPLLRAIFGGGCQAQATYSSSCSGCSSSSTPVIQTASYQTFGGGCVNGTCPIRR